MNKKRIFKYALKGAGRMHRIQMPAGYTIISVQNQHGVIALWVIVDPTRPPVEAKIRVYLTGEEMDIDPVVEHFLGTVQLDNGDFVCHVFEQVHA